MPPRANAKTIADLQEAIERIEGGGRRHSAVLPFGVPSIVDRLPRGGLAYGAIHEIAGGGVYAVSGTASAAFAAGISGRTTGQVIWWLSRPDIFAPGLA